MATSSSPPPPPPNSTAHTFEDAIALARTGLFQYMLLFTCGFCFLAFMSQIFIVSIAVPFVKCDFKSSANEEGFLTAAGFLGVVFSAHLMGFLGDTWGRIKTLKLSLSISIVFSILSVFSVNIWMLIVTRFLTGFFIAGCQSCAYSLCGEFHSSRTRARHVTLISTFFNCAIIFCAILAILILPNHFSWHLAKMKMSPWRLLLLAVNIASVVALIMIWYTPETPKYDLIQGNNERALKTLQKIFKWNTKRPVEEYPVHSVTFERSGSSISDIRNFRDAMRIIWKQTAQTFSKQRILNTLNFCVILSTMYGISHGILMWYATIVAQELKMPKENLCYVVSVIPSAIGSSRGDNCHKNVDILTYLLVSFVGIFFTLIYLVFAFTVDIIGKRIEIIIWSCVCAALAIAIPWIANVYLGFMSLAILASIGVCGGLAATIAFEFYPTNISAMSMCLIMMIGRLAAGLGSYIFRQFMFSHCHITFRVVAAILFIIAILCWLLPEKKRVKKAKEKKAVN